MQNKKFTLEDKMQYVSKLLGRQQIVRGDMEQRVLGELLASTNLTDSDFESIRRYFQVFKDELIQSHAAIYDVLNARDPKQAISVVRGICGAASK